MNKLESILKTEIKHKTVDLNSAKSLKEYLETLFSHHESYLKHNKQSIFNEHIKNKDTCTLVFGTTLYTKKILSDTSTSYTVSSKSYNSLNQLFEKPILKLYVTTSN